MFTCTEMLYIFQPKGTWWNHNLDDLRKYGQLTTCVSWIKSRIYVVYATHLYSTFFLHCHVRFTFFGTSNVSLHSQVSPILFSILMIVTLCYNEPLHYWILITPCCCQTGTLHSLWVHPLRVYVQSILACSNLALVCSKCSVCCTSGISVSLPLSTYLVRRQHQFIKSNSLCCVWLPTYSNCPQRLPVNISLSVLKDS